MQNIEQLDEESGHAVTYWVVPFSSKSQYDLKVKIHLNLV